MKLIHAADLHLDSPLRGLSAYEGAPIERVREATRKAFRNLVDLCLKEKPDALLLVGDVFDGDWRDFSTGLYFVKELERLRPLPVLIVRGNHDAVSEVTQRLRLPPHVHEFSDENAETKVIGGCAFHGLSFTRRVLAEDLVPRYPAPLAGLFNVGLLHTSCDGRATQHKTYAPCTVEELVQKGYDYWALGHVHAHAVLHERPHIVFPGNTQGRHIKETGPKGCVVVTVGSDVRVEHVPLDVVRWKLIEIQLGADDDLEALYARARAAFDEARREAEGRLCAARLSVTGACRAHAAIAGDLKQVEAELRRLTFEWPDELWLEEVRLRTRPPLDLDALRASEGFLGELLRAGAGGELQDAFKPLVDKIGVELKEAGLDLGDPQVASELCAEAEALLATRLGQ